MMFDQIDIQMRSDAGRARTNHRSPAAPAPDSAGDTGHARVLTGADRFGCKRAAKL